MFVEFRGVDLDLKEEQNILENLESDNALIFKKT